MTDNDPTFPLTPSIDNMLRVLSESLASLDEGMSMMRREIAPRQHDLEYDNLVMWHKSLDRVRNTLADELASIGENYGHPDWQLDSEED